MDSEEATFINERIFTNCNLIKGECVKIEGLVKKWGVDGSK